MHKGTPKEFGVKQGVAVGASIGVVNWAAI
jgi:hypothetical protein